MSLRTRMPALRHRKSPSKRLTDPLSGCNGFDPNCRGMNSIAEMRRWMGGIGGWAGDRVAAHAIKIPTSRAKGAREMGHPRSKSPPLRLRSGQALSQNTRQGWGIQMWMDCYEFRTRLFFPLPWAAEGVTCCNGLHSRCAQRRVRPSHLAAFSSPRIEIAQ